VKLGWSTRTASNLAAFPLAVLLAASGCTPTAPEGDQRGPIQSGSRGGLFESVAETLNRFEDFDTAQILKQTTDRLNQWTVQEKPEIAWTPDPLLEKLAPSLRKLPDVQRLDTLRFNDPDDGWFLQEAVWLRDVSKTARADKFADVEVAEQLFDWTVRNIRLLPPAGPSDVRHRPFETLLLSRGTALERAWIFILLARQQGLDVVYLGIEEGEGGAVRPWLPALLSDDQLYLFDMELGLAVPGPKPGSVATLAEVVADPGLLRKLDLDAEHPYPVTEENLKHVVAFVEGMPQSLSRRMALVESRLVADQRLKLMSPGSALAERVAKLPNIARVELWPVPFEVILSASQRDEKAQNAALRETVIYQAMPSLKRGRALHFKGHYDGEDGAKAQYLAARQSDDYIAKYTLPPDVAQQYLKQGYSAQAIARLEAAQSLMMRDAKQAASYWIGLTFYDQKDYPNAIDYFENRTLGAKSETAWADAARYNLARTYEASGNMPKAIELYEADTTSPQSHGNRLRAKWLKEQAQPSEATTEPEPAPASTPAEAAPAKTPASDSSPPAESPTDEAPKAESPKAEEPVDG